MVRVREALVADAADLARIDIETWRTSNAGILPVDAGLNRFVWDLDYEGASKVPHAPLWGGSTSGRAAADSSHRGISLPRGGGEVLPVA